MHTPAVLPLQILDSGCSQNLFSLQQKLGTPFVQHKLVRKASFKDAT